MQNSTLNITQLDQLSSENVLFGGKGAIGTVSAGQIGNIDLQVVDDCFLNGGILKVKGSAFGDSARCQVVHPVSGTVLNEFVTDYYMDDVERIQFNLELPYFSKIVAGLVLRIAYKSTGAQDVSVAINWKLHKTKY